MQLQAVLARANSAIGQGIRYKLGKGGFNPGNPSPAQSNECDCTGFISWCFGMSRQTRDHFYVQFNNGGSKLLLFGQILDLVLEFLSLPMNRLVR